MEGTRPDPLFRSVVPLMSEDYDNLFRWHLLGIYLGKLCSFLSDHGHPFRRRLLGVYLDNHCSSLSDHDHLFRWRLLGVYLGKLLLVDQGHLFRCYLQHQLRLRLPGIIWSKSRLAIIQTHRVCTP